MIVGIGHVARVGKDTAAQALCRDLGFRRIGFADKLKDLAMEADPMIFANQMTNVGVGSGHLRKIVVSHGWERTKDSFTEARSFLQNLGVGARKIFGPNFWVEQALAGVSPEDNIVVPDVRFFEELEAIRALGGKTIRITRPGRLATGHVSEIALCEFDDWDATIDNNGSVIELEGKIVGTVRNWLAKAPSTEAPSESRVER